MQYQCMLTLANLGTLEEHIDDVEARGQIVEVRGLGGEGSDVGNNENKEPTKVVIDWNWPTMMVAV